METLNSIVQLQIIAGNHIHKSKSKLKSTASRQDVSIVIGKVGIIEMD